MSTIVFIHGLNTYGDDDVHIGPIKLGPMHRELSNALKMKSIQMISLKGLGTGSIEDQGREALKKISSLNLPPKFHLLGQSTGGLTARYLANSPEVSQRILCLMTLGTPHFGTRAADLGVNFPKSHPVWSMMFKLFGYETASKSEIFKYFTPAAMTEFNKRAAKANRIRNVSLICEVDATNLSWPLKALYAKLHPDHEPSDGFIWSQSQRFGEEIGPFRLDHFGELGVFPFLSKNKKSAAKKEFARLIDTIAAIVSD